MQGLWFMLLPISARTSGRPRILMHVDVDRASLRDAFFAVQVCGFRGDLSGLPSRYRDIRALARRVTGIQM